MGLLTFVRMSIDANCAKTTGSSAKP